MSFYWLRKQTEGKHNWKGSGLGVKLDSAWVEYSVLRVTKME